MNTQSTQRFVSDTASTRDSARLSSTHLGSTQRFVSDFAAIRIVTRRFTSWRSSPLRNSAQRNDLLVTTTPQLCTPCRITPHLDAFHRSSTQRFVSDVAPFRSASPRSATQRTSLQLNDLLVTPQRVAPQLRTALLASSQLNDLLITKLRSATIRSASPRNSTQRFVSNLAALRNALLRNTLHRSSSQLNDLLVTTTSRRRSLQRVAPQCTASHLFSTQRNRLM